MINIRNNTHSKINRNHLTTGYTDHIEGVIVRIIPPQDSKITQGTIICSLYVHGYEDCQTSGIVLTARCDLENSKNSVIHILPIVKFDDWSERDLCDIVARRALKSDKNSFSEMLTKKNVSKFIQDTFDPEEIIVKQIPANERKQFNEKLVQIRRIDQVIDLNGVKCTEAKGFLKTHQKISKAVIRELVQHKLSEYYFLENINPLVSSKTGYVVLFRRMIILPAAIAIHCGKNGVCLDDLSRYEGRYPGISNSFTFDFETSSIPTGTLRSPDIEHLTLQR